MNNWSEKPFRLKAAAFRLENEASVVYLFDEGNRRLLQKSPLAEPYVRDYQTISAMWCNAVPHGIETSPMAFLRARCGSPYPSDRRI